MGGGAAESERGLGVCFESCDLLVAVVLHASRGTPATYEH